MHCADRDAGAVATLATQDAGRVVGRIFTQEAYLSLFVAIVVLLLERRAAATSDGETRLSVPMLLALAPSSVRWPATSACSR